MSVGVKMNDDELRREMEQDRQIEARQEAQDQEYEEWKASNERDLVKEFAQDYSELFEEYCRNEFNEFKKAGF